MRMGTATGLVQRRGTRSSIHKGLGEFLPTSVQKSYFMLSDAERDVLNSALEKYRTGQAEPILVGGEKQRRGCVVASSISRLFNRATCNTRLSVSTWSSFIPQASDTHKPRRNIRSNRQRSRTSFLLPLVASINRSTFRMVRCFRSLPPSPPASV